MKFSEGHKKVGGRKKGTPNKKTEQWEKFSEYCLQGGLEKFEQELNKLEGKQYVDAFLTILEFHKPKLSRTTLEGGENPIRLDHINLKIQKRAPKDD